MDVADGGMDAAVDANGVAESVVAASVVLENVVLENVVAANVAAVNAAAANGVVASVVAASVAAASVDRVIVAVWRTRVAVGVSGVAARCSRPTCRRSAIC